MAILSPQPLVTIQEPATAPASPEAAGLVWAQRFKMAPNAQEAMNTTPLFRDDCGKLALDMQQVEKLAQRDVDVRNLLSKFSEAVKKTGVKLMYGPSETAVSVQNSVNGVRPRTAEVVKATRVVDSLRVTGKRARDVALMPGTAPVVGVKGLSEERAFELATTPVGLCEFDHVALWDAKRRRLTGEHIEVPENAYEGASMNSVIPRDDVKFLFRDGDGYKVGGNSVMQHAVRLEVHRKHCGDARCRVLGCGACQAFNLFKDVASDQVVCEYEQHWRDARRKGLKAHNSALRAVSRRI